MPIVTAEEDERKLLLVDSLRLHKNNERLLRLNRNDITVKYIPEHCTALLQPLDIGVIRLFKRSFREIWARNDVRGRQITRTEISAWILEAWRNVPEENVANSFTRYIDLDDGMDLE